MSGVIGKGGGAWCLTPSNFKNESEQKHYYALTLRYLILMP
jgi:hypothetical protein